MLPASASATPAPSPFARRDRLIGLSIIGAAFVLALAISLWAKKKSRPEQAVPPAPPTTVGVVGWPKNVDAVRTLGAARQLTGRPLLRGIVAFGVNSDGTVDLTEGPGQILFSFQSPPTLAAQIAVDAGAPRRRYCGVQRVALVKQGLVAEPDQAFRPCSQPHPDALPDPRCGFKDVWKRAIARGAPKDQLAHIEYYRAKAGPAWRFDMAGTQHHFVLYGDCGRELSPAEAAGHVP